MSDTAISQMLSSYGRFPVLSPERQLMLARTVRQWLDHPAPCPPDLVRRGQRAKQRLIETNIRLVISFTSRFSFIYRNNPDRLQDLIQAGIFGLNRATELFDPARGYQFSTYATGWIRQALGRAAHREFNVIRLPDDLTHLWRKLGKLITTYEAEHGRRPDIDELCTLSGLPRKTIERTIVCGSMRIVSSIDRPANMGDGLTNIVELLPDPASLDPDNNSDTLRDDRYQHLHSLIQQLPKPDQDLIINVALGGMTQGEYGQTVGLSRSRIGQRHQRALQRLREIALVAA